MSIRHLFLSGAALALAATLAGPAALAQAVAAAPSALDLPQVLQAARQKQVIEAQMVKDIKANQLDRSWMEATLKRLNCYVEE